MQLIHQCEVPMSFSVDMRSVDELTDDPEDPMREQIVDAYGNRPLTGTRQPETSYEFSYETLPPEAIRRVIGDNDEAIGLLIDHVPETDPDDPFAPKFFSVTKLARDLKAKYPEIAVQSLQDAYKEYESHRLNDEQVLAAVLIDFARDPLPGYPVVVFSC